MSTILKALKQSEARRPRNVAPGSPLPGAPSRRSASRYWLALGAAVAGLALASLALWFFRDPVGGAPSPSAERPRGIAEVRLPERADANAEGKPGGGSESPETGKATADQSADPAGENGRSKPVRDEKKGAEVTGAGNAIEPRAAPDAAPPGKPGPDARKTNRRLDPYALLPRLSDLPPERRNALPEITLNAHVYAPPPDESFVLINLSRYGEGDRIAAGLSVAAIFPDGVVLEDGEGRFVLPRP